MPYSLENHPCFTYLQGLFEGMSLSDLGSNGELEIQKKDTKYDMLFRLSAPDEENWLITCLGEYIHAHYGADLEFNVVDVLNCLGLNPYKTPTDSDVLEFVTFMDTLLLSKSFSLGHTITSTKYLAHIRSLVTYVASKAISRLPSNEDNSSKKDFAKDNVAVVISSIELINTQFKSTSITFRLRLSEYYDYVSLDFKCNLGYANASLLLVRVNDKLINTNLVSWVPDFQFQLYHLIKRLSICLYLFKSFKEFNNSLLDFKLSISDYISFQLLQHPEVENYAFSLLLNPDICLSTTTQKERGLFYLNAINTPFDLKKSMKLQFNHETASGNKLMTSEGTPEELANSFNNLMSY